MISGGTEIDEASFSASINLCIRQGLPRTLLLFVSYVLGSRVFKNETSESNKTKQVETKVPRGLLEGFLKSSLGILKDSMWMP